MMIKFVSEEDELIAEVEFSDDEFAQIEHAAGLDGLTVEEWIIRAIREYLAGVSQRLES